MVDAVRCESAPQSRAAIQCAEKTQTACPHTIALEGIVVIGESPMAPVPADVTLVAEGPPVAQEVSAATDARGSFVVRIEADQCPTCKINIRAKPHAPNYQCPNTVVACADRKLEIHCTESANPEARRRRRERIPPPESTGRLTLEAYPWAVVYVGGKRLRVDGRARPLTLPAGRLTVRFCNDNFHPLAREVDVPANGEASISVRWWADGEGRPPRPCE
jgi:hypothetical protein